MVGNGALSDEVLGAILERERQFPTGIGYGVAVPHGKTPVLPALVVQHVGQRVRLGGWVHRRRDLVGIVFVDLRDRAGIVQVAVGPAAPEHVRRTAGGLTGETVVEVEGEVVARPGNMKNPELATGDVEVHPSKLTVVGLAVTPAIPVPRAQA